MSSSCSSCFSGTGDAAPAWPSVPCSTSRLVCKDILSVLVKAILTLNETNGSTADTIAEQAVALCPTSDITSEDVAAGLATAAKRGILFRRYESVHVDPTYMINARMVEANPKNAPYMRYPCQQNNFYRPRA